MSLRRTAGLIRTNLAFTDVRNFVASAIGLAASAKAASQANRVLVRKLDAVLIEVRPTGIHPFSAQTDPLSSTDPEARLASRLAWFHRLTSRILSSLSLIHI